MVLYLLTSQMDVDGCDIPEVVKIGVFTTLNKAEKAIVEYHNKWFSKKTNLNEIKKTKSRIKTGEKDVRYVYYVQDSGIVYSVEVIEVDKIYF